MRTLVSVAVFGLVPVPPMPDTSISSCDDLQAKSEHIDLVPLAMLSAHFSERMATKEEIARIREEIKALGVVGAKRTYWRP